MDDNITKKADIWQVSRALEGSRARREIYYHLCAIAPREESVKELKLCANLTLANCYGALVGSGRDYKTESSLVGLGLVERVPAIVGGKTVDAFGATAYGLEIREGLRGFQQRFASASIKPAMENSRRVGVSQTQ